MGTLPRQTPEEGGSRSGQRWTLSSLGPGATVAPRAVPNKRGGQYLTHLCGTVTRCGLK